MPAISIIVPIYNVEPYLRKCVDSILAQTFTDYEAILVNDGSTDHCGEICEQYARQDGRIKVVHKTNGGLSDARNFGIRAAQGDFLGFVDSDDWIEPRMFEVLYRLCTERGADIGICSFHTWEQSGARKRREHTDAVTECGSEAAIRFMYDGKLGGFPAWNKLYRAGLFQDIKFPKGRVYEDAAIMYKLYDRAGKIVHIDMPLYNYIHRPASITRSSFSPKRFDIVPTYIEAYPYMQINHPDMCDKLSSIFLEDLRKIAVDIMKESGWRSNYRYLGDVSRLIREHCREFMRNPLIPLRHKVIARLLAKGPAMGAMFYKMRFFSNHALRR